MMGGTRFIGLYLARQLVQEGHEVTLYTRGKKAISSKIADDTEEGYKNFAASIKHIQGDRMASWKKLYRTVSCLYNRPLAASRFLYNQPLNVLSY